MDHGDPEVFLHEHLPRLARYAAILTGDREQAHDVTVERAASCVAAPAPGFAAWIVPRGGSPGPVGR